MTGALMESIIAGLWEKVLGVGKVGLDDNFFSIGGNSLLMIHVHRALCQTLDREIPIMDLFGHPTVRALAAALQSGEMDAAPSRLMRPDAAANSLPLTGPPSPANPLVERALKQRAAQASMRDRANDESRSG
jgi:nonribosomal peptide synthetase DhbF